jgi:hypothetical protein
MYGDSFTRQAPLAPAWSRKNPETAVMRTNAAAVSEKVRRDL